MLANHRPPARYPHENIQPETGIGARPQVVARVEMPYETIQPETYPLPQIPYKIQGVWSLTTHSYHFLWTILKDQHIKFQETLKQIQPLNDLTKI